jgi:CheY-like chemotaxis protein/HPt (histidine-containing phosphotransfer) domain-containing protein
MSHEIRTPFQGLMGMLSLLRETGLAPRQVDYLRTATESADRLLAILNDILDMSQIESGRITLAPGPVEVRLLLRDVEALMRPQAMAKQLALHIDADPAVPERVLADATRIKQIVSNLLANAIKFSDRGAVVVDVRPQTDPQGRAMLAFVVTDTGIGMDSKTVAQLFQRFGQGDAARARLQGGTGLGLEIARRLARLMGGDVTVRSKLGEGSAFTFVMPAVAVPGVVQPALPRAPGGRASDRPLQVLVAEDHAVNREYMSALLANLNHQAHFTVNGQEAVAAASQRPFDLVLMDLHMPVLDGIAATRAIRALKEPSRSTVPIVALTADAFDETRDRCLLAGMNDFLTKPVSPQQLATLLRRLFGTGQGAATGVLGVAAEAQAQASLAPAAPGTEPLVDENSIAMALHAMPGSKLLALIEAFLDQGPDTAAHLRAAVRDAQPLDLRMNVHAAKGAALNLGLAGLAATATALHDGATHLPAHEIARLVQRFEDQLPRTRQAVAALHLDELAQAVATR